MADTDSPSGIPGPDSFPTTLEPYLGAVLLETFFFGLYTVLFSICAFVLLQRRRKIHWILPVFALSMYLLATADMAYTLWLLFGKLLKMDLSYQALRWKFWMYVMNNVLADTLLLYRCYVVWDYDKRVVFGPAVLLVAATVCGFLFEGTLSSKLFTNSWVYPLITLVLNVILTCLTASRIWFLSRRTRKLVDPSLLQRYNVTLSMLVESGFVYSLYMVLDLAFHKDPNGSIVLDASLIQVVGIMPTLIIAQIGVGRAVHDIEANFRSTHIESGQTAPTVSSKTEIRTPATDSMRSLPFSGKIAIRVDTKKQMYDVSLPPSRSAPSLHRREYSGYNGYPYVIGHSPTANEPLAQREFHYVRTRCNSPYLQNYSPDDEYHYNFASHRVGEVVDLPRDIDEYYDADLTNGSVMDGSVLDYVLRVDEEKGVAPWTEKGDNRTPLPQRHGSARLKKSRPVWTN